MAEVAGLFLYLFIHDSGQQMKNARNRGEFLSEAVKDGQGSSVMVSYSRKDKVFVKALYEALSAGGREIWVDWEDIPPSADWLDEIHRGLGFCE